MKRILKRLWMKTVFEGFFQIFQQILSLEKIKQVKLTHKNLELFDKKFKTNQMENDD